MSGLIQIKVEANAGWFVWLILTVLAVPACAGESQATASAGSFLDMPIEQLMQVSVSGTLTETDKRRSPVSMTVITADDIAVTPARNLLDLIQIYVPGAFWLNHSVGPQLAMRGIVADRDYKWLITVNGINVNNRIMYGAISELSMWDTADIERVEIVRGPGSVTYGPGAIAGVINITIKNAITSPGTEVGSFYWDKYVAKGFHVSHGYQGKKEEPSVFGYFSDTKSAGLSSDNYQLNATQSGYMGKEPPRGQPPASLLGSFYGDNQIKAYAEADFRNGWRFWTRYTDALIPNNTGTDIRYPKNGNTNVTQSPPGTWIDMRTFRERQFIATIENKQKLSSDFSLQSTFSVLSTEAKVLTTFMNRSTAANIPYLPNSQNNMRNIGTWVSENIYYTRLQLNYDPNEWFKAAIGVEYSYNSFGPGWGKGADSGFRITNMVSGPSSEAYGTTGTGAVSTATSDYMAVGNGWHTDNYALFGELNMDLSQTWSALLSARIDKHVYTDFMFSPRAAIINEFAPNHFVTLSAQRSVRMNTEDELYRMNRDKSDVKPEKLDTYQLMYNGEFGDGLSAKANLFYNDNQVIAWDAVQRRSAPVGRLKTIGLELEGAYETETFQLGANHAFVKQLKWQVDPDVGAAGVSYSDYTYFDSASGVTLNGQGNDLNNYANNITKLFSNIRLFDKKVILHGDMQTFWGWEGGRDGLRVVKDSGGNTTTYDELHAREVYGITVSGNVSLTYRLDKSASISVFLQNIPIYGENKRYMYSSGNKVNFPTKTAWIEEPMVLGTRFTARF